MKFYLDIPVTFPNGIIKQYDLIVPNGNPHDIPLLVWIHGGGWCGGEKRIFNDFERFVYRGFAVLAIDYRFAQEEPFPAQLIDCKMAIRWARAHAQTYGYNADKIIVGGNSAGGHLASLMGVTNGSTAYDCDSYLQYSSDVQAVVDEYGPINLYTSELPGLSDALTLLLNNDINKIHDASPLQLITGKEPPFLILHGTADPVVPVSQSLRFYQALKTAGINVQYYVVPDGNHGFDDANSYDILTNFILSNLR